MTSTGIIERLRQGETLLMDGATGSELQRRGVDTSKGAKKGALGVWSASANVDAPDVVRAIHEEYFSAGADLVISNSFYTSRPKLAVIGQEARWEEYARAAGEIAAGARDSVSPASHVAGGIAPPGEGDLCAEFQAVARVLADAGVDLMLPEYVASIEEAVVSVEACAVVGLPVFLGICHVSADGAMRSGETVADLAVALRGRPVDAVLIMCTSPEDISAALPRLRDAFECAVGAYANTGYRVNPNFGESEGEKWHVFRDGCPPDRYADFAAQWREMGASIIGGGCGSTPAHVQAIRPAVKD